MKVYICFHDKNDMLNEQNSGIRTTFPQIPGSLVAEICPLVLCILTWSKWVSLFAIHNKSAYLCRY